MSGVFFFLWKSKATREKNQKKCPWKKKVPVKIFLKFHPWNWIWCPWKKLKNVPVKGEKCAWKNFIDLEKYILGFNFSMGSRYYFAIGVRENYIFWKKYQPGKKFKFVPVKPTFPPVKKNQKSAREKNKWAWKNGKKCAWKRFSASEKKRQKCQKGFSRALFIFTGNKIHTRNFKIANNPQKLHVKFCEILV